MNSSVPHTVDAVRTAIQEATECVEVIDGQDPKSRTFVYDTPLGKVGETYFETVIVTPDSNPKSF